MREAMVEKNGGKILGGVSTKLNYLVVGEDAGIKLEKAKKITYDQNHMSKRSSFKLYKTLEFPSIFFIFVNIFICSISRIRLSYLRNFS